MNATKQKILTQSLSLFNEKGISNVSLRAIADKAGISVGNLQYHFKKREDIVEGLYFQLVEKIDGISLTLSEDILKSFFSLAEQVMTIFFEYHFFLLDFTTVTRGNQKIKLHYATLSKRREIEFLKVIDVMIEQGLFRKEMLENEYQNLFKRTEVISNFWFSSLLIQADTLTEDAINEYTLMINQSIYPYLTKKGKEEYNRLMDS
ncbi:TetR/AcrR family transcriptional regulator [Flammeovirga agarivorans]|uniref:TetR/AcrR family transcriptional regulator n=1 Tax=Flammeovirga agarivorans TaxID=2726742 RepID=A0A7X8XY09_9BACT|nr:TetR/AcrR family transcriptional regulator [Flammeovirga agarivorans]NLR93781.1 TetR/AcrR family transcriptional regulator [Flammeovirga agarivorans]